MAYPTKNLNPDEIISLDLRPHWWYFSKHILTGIPLLLLFVVVVVSGGWVQTGLQWIWIALAIAWAVWLVFKFFAWRFTFFMVSNQRVVYRTGVVARHGTEIPLSRINNINFDQSVFNRMIGAGDLEIESAGKEGMTRFDNVRHPDAVQQEIYRQMENRQRTEASWVGGQIGEAVEAGVAEAAAPLTPEGDAPTDPGVSPSVPPAPGASTGSAVSAGSQEPTVASRIEDLARLRDQGLITPEEFEAKKAQLLDQI